MDIFKNELTTLWNVTCPKCNSEILNKNGKYKGRQRFICLDCGFSFTTYSKSLLDSTKISQAKWDAIIFGIIKGNTLKEISEVANISIITASKIRIKILKMLDRKATFLKALKKYYYNPFDTDTYFFTAQKDGTLYYIKHNDQTYILLIKDKHNQFCSNVVSKKDFNLLLTDITYKNLSIIPYSEISENEIVNYIDSIIHSIKNCKGIKSSFLPLYVNFFTLRLNIGPHELHRLIEEKMCTYKQ